VHYVCVMVIRHFVTTWLVMMRMTKSKFQRMYQCLVQQALSIIVSTGRDTFMVFMDKEKDVEPVKSHHPQDYSVEECECNQAIDLNKKEDRVEIMMVHLFCYVILTYLKALKRM
jgi:hypothetical protein